MNANELADEWHKKNPMMDERELYAWGDEAATMLRQQQAEIEALKYEKSSGVYDLAKTLTNEEYKPLTEADAPYQKVAPKEVADAIDKALGLKTPTNEEMLKQIRHAISGYFDDAYSYSDELYYKIKAILERTTNDIK